MKGAPIQGATVAARAFLDERKKRPAGRHHRLQPERRDALGLHHQQGAISLQAVAKAPATAEGTHIYDALIEAANKAKDQGLERTTVVLLSDGANFDTSTFSLAEALRR